jgi:hypothetical protein
MRSFKRQASHFRTKALENNQGRVPQVSPLIPGILQRDAQALGFSLQAAAEAFVVN